MGLLGGIARTAVVAGTATAVGGRVRRRQERRWAAKDDQAAQGGDDQGYDDEQAAPQVPEQRAASSTTDMLDQLKSLGELKDQGVLTEAEFAVQKDKILPP